jgi:hypothetical protein
MSQRPGGAFQACRKSSFNVAVARWSGVFNRLRVINRHKEFKMHQPLFSPRPALALSLLCAAALTACGGGGGDADGSTSTSADEATAYAANATLMKEDATAAFDVSVLAAQNVVAAQAAAASSAPATNALAVAGEEATRPAAVASVPVACAGGGSATLSITGGTAVSVLNGQLDAGEVYQLAFSDCRGVAGAASVNGSLAMTVLSASATDLSLALVANDLAVSLPQGGVTLAGSTTRQASVATLANGTTQFTSRFTSPGITLSTRFNNRSSVFTLSAVDVTRQSLWLLGLPLSSTLKGTHTLAATLPNAAFNYTVSTQGTVSYSAAGVPTAGSWTITLPRTLIAVTVANATATVTVDDAKDGTIDRTVTVPVARLQSEAG